MMMMMMMMMMIVMIMMIMMMVMIMMMMLILNDMEPYRTMGSHREPNGTIWGYDDEMIWGHMGPYGTI